MHISGIRFFGNSVQLHKTQQSHTKKKIEAHRDRIQGKETYGRINNGRKEETKNIHEQILENEVDKK